MKKEKSTAVIIQEPKQTKDKTIELPVIEPARAESVKPAIMKAEKAIKPETTKIQEIPLKPSKTVAPEITVKPPTSDANLIIKSGTTDLRRGAKQLATDSKTRMGNPHDGNIRAYANRFKTTVKLVQEKPDGTTLVTMSYNKPVEWPEYQPPDKEGHTVTLNGKEKDTFLEERNCPKAL
ncbi:hypothetical protein FACS1894137_03750 [Spirochaetia bacterium]|nr:hypothetical protein FACS1894137_03750 [Spirochaetia bacterium]